MSEQNQPKRISNLEALSTDEAKQVLSALPNSGFLEVMPATRVTHITIGRTINVGDYSNIRYEVGVDIGVGDSAAAVLAVLDTVLANIQQPKKPAMVEQYEKMAAIPEEKRDEQAKAYLSSDRILAEVDAYNQRLKRWNNARALLDDLAGNEVYKDHKAQWMDDPNLEGS